MWSQRWKPNEVVPRKCLNSLGFFYFNFPVREFLSCRFVYLSFVASTAPRDWPIALRLEDLRTFWLVEKAFHGTFIFRSTIRQNTGTCLTGIGAAFRRLRFWLLFLFLFYSLQTGFTFSLQFLFLLYVFRKFVSSLTILKSKSVLWFFLARGNLRLLALKSIQTFF